MSNCPFARLNISRILFVLVFAVATIVSTGIQARAQVISGQPKIVFGSVRND